MGYIEDWMRAKTKANAALKEKVPFLRDFGTDGEFARHRRSREPISKLCDEVGLQPTVFYRWQKE